MDHSLYRITLFQMDISIGQPEINFKHVELKLQEALEGKVRPDVVILPEMWNTGYSLTNIHQIADESGKETIALCSRFAKQYQINLVAGSIAKKQGDHIYNHTYIFDRKGNIISNYAKIHLFGLMEENHYLTSGNELGVFEIDGISAGGIICYDLRFPELSRRLALEGAKILFIPAQWPHPRLHHWRSLLIARAIENQMYVVACNRVGTSGDSTFFGHSMVIDPWGEVLLEGHEQEEIFQITIDLDLVQQVRSKIPIFADRRPSLYK